AAVPRGDQRCVRHRGSGGRGMGHGAPAGRRRTGRNIKSTLPGRRDGASLPIRTVVRTRDPAAMRPYDERLDHLLIRAAGVFADRGYHSTTMRDLAAATGMSLAGMYYYVRGKEQLLCFIQERCFGAVLEGGRAAVAAAGQDPLERLQAFIRHHVTYFAAHMAEMKVLSHEAT